MSHIPTLNSLFLDLEIIMKIKFQLPMVYLTIDDFGYYAKVRFDISFSNLCTYLWHTNIMKINPEKSVSYVGNLYVFNCLAIPLFLPLTCRNEFLQFWSLLRNDLYTCIFCLQVSVQLRRIFWIQSIMRLNIVVQIYYSIW